MMRNWISLLRPSEWLKNVLLFVPLLAAHQIVDRHQWLLLMGAFISFSGCASSVYLINDFLDVQSDRQHPVKKHRPFASGKVHVGHAMLLLPILLGMSFLMAINLSWDFFLWLLTYFVLTCLYSWKLKQFILVDCLMLAMFYTLRVIAGGAVVHIVPSFWLLEFSYFIALSLSFVKRYTELNLNNSIHQTPIHGRGYVTTDITMIQSLGIGSGFSAVMILSLYLNNPVVSVLYPNPEFVFLTIPVVLFWLGWLWMQAHRGCMHDHPVVFAITNKVSLMSGGVFAVLVILGSMPKFEHLF